MDRSRVLVRSKQVLVHSRQVLERSKLELVHSMMVLALDSTGHSMMTLV
jgi:hypothetical protein